MAVAIAQASGAPWPVARSARAIKDFPVLITGDSAYPTGGSSVTPAAVGLAAIHMIGTALSTDGTVMAVWDGVNQKLKCFSTNAAPVVEVADTTSLATKKFPTRICGV